jgi:GNAT superfamily N-acetyltransferase
MTSIRRMTEDDLDAVVALSLAAWAPVFASVEEQLGSSIFTLLYPDWRSAQAAAVRAVCTEAEHAVWVAAVEDRPVGFVAVGFLDEDAARAGEIHMIAVDPDHQGAGVGASLMQHALNHIAAHGVDLAIVATGGDAGHAPGRALYERFGFIPFPLVRYYRTP